MSRNIWKASSIVAGAIIIVGAGIVVLHELSERSSTGGPPPSSVARATVAAIATPTPTSPLPDPCKVVTLDEAQLLAGTSLDPGVDGMPTFPVCTYSSPPTSTTAQVVVYLGDKAKQILDVDRQFGNVLTPLPGIGDEAYEEVGAVFVRKGTLWCAIHLVRLNDPAANRKPLEDLLLKAAARL
ncbi:MAG: DUF3558 domain-containing protein [Candidatus Dormibacteraeota bacterium]|nr:DUF3558 domain-containing protein [Candidatus Dormibacteraeota bacterium]